MTRGFPNALRAAKKTRLRVRLAARDGARCFYCWRPFDDLDRAATFDHFIPRRYGRVCGARGLVLACYGCNNRKGDTLPRGLVLVLLVRDVKADIVHQPVLQGAA